jgi:hypothetical protein
MPKHMRREEIVTIQVLNEKGENNCKVARLLGVSEGTVRYHLGCAASGAVDGRQNKPSKAESVTTVIEASTVIENVPFVAIENVPPVGGQSLGSLR